MKNAARDKPAVMRRYIVSAAVLLVLVVVLAVTIFQVFGPPAARRSKASQVIRAELATLPPYASSSIVGENIYSGPLRDPVLEEECTLSGTCVDVQRYYGELAPIRGWALDHTPNPSASVLDSDFHKARDGISLNLTAECYVGQSKSAGYILIIRAS